MKTLLVLAKNTTLAEAIRAVLDPEYYRVIHYQEVWAAEPLFSREIFDACFLDADLTDIRPLRILDQLRRATPQCPGSGSGKRRPTCRGWSISFPNRSGRDC